jgi:hypothetical protein
MAKYYTKCGREFNKSSKSVVTGYQITENESGKIIDEKCDACPFVVEVQDGWPERVHKRYECRAGSEPPNHKTEYTGNADDKCSLHIHSLDHILCESILEYVESEPDLTGGYLVDSKADCRKTVSISCSQNKKGMAAKKAFIERFFLPTKTAKKAYPGTALVSEDEYGYGSETCDECDYYSENESVCDTGDKKRKPVRAKDKACYNFCPKHNKGLNDYKTFLYDETQLGLDDDTNNNEEDVPSCDKPEKKPTLFVSCSDCICKRCLLFWSQRCDDQKCKEQGCKGGIFYPATECDRFIEYDKTKTVVKSCLKANVTEYQDGYRKCSLIDTIGCKKCFKEWERRLDKDTSQFHPRCPYLGSHGDTFIQCAAHAKILGTMNFDSDDACDEKVDNHCFGRFLDCESYRKYYADRAEHQSWVLPDRRINYETCAFCCNSTGYTGLPEGYDGQAYCYCQKHQKTMKKDEACEWHNRHPEWKFEIEEEPSMEADLISKATISTFNYTGLDYTIIETLRTAESEIAKIKMQTVYDIGNHLTLAHKALANHKSGIFGEWCESIGFSRQSAQNYMRAYDFIRQNFDNIQEAAKIQPSLLFAASKPSAPPELAKAVVEGDITKHKDYMAKLAAVKKVRKPKAELIQEDTIPASCQADIGNDEPIIETLFITSEQPLTGAYISDAVDMDEQTVEERGDSNTETLTAPTAAYNSEYKQVVSETAIDSVRTAQSIEWYSRVQAAIRLIAGLDDRSIDLLVETAGNENYTFMTGALRLTVMEAADKLKQLENTIAGATAPVDGSAASA